MPKSLSFLWRSDNRFEKSKIKYGTIKHYDKLHKRIQPYMRIENYKIQYSNKTRHHKIQSHNRSTITKKKHSSYCSYTRDLTIWNPAYGSITQRSPVTRTWLISRRESYKRAQKSTSTWLDCTYLCPVFIH